jgi:starvation-inducible DNA-binding protein
MGKINKLLTRTARPAPGPLETPTDLAPEAVAEIAEGLNALVADTYALYFKTKNFHWHVSGPHFRDYHLLFDEQATELFETTDELAERVRKIGGGTLRSIGHISRLQRVQDNNQEFVPPREMLRELMADNKAMMENLRDVHEIADEHGDIGTTSLLEVFIDRAEKRNWFLFEASRRSEPSGH